MFLKKLRPIARDVENVVKYAVVNGDAKEFKSCFQTLKALSKIVKSKVIRNPSHVCEKSRER